jgi:D-sedoheptulose 7-phosphate isomerase
MMRDKILTEFVQAQEVLSRFMTDPKCVQQIQRAAELIIGCIHGGGKIISCGNGGSHCDAMHFAEELTGRYRESRIPLPALVISDPSYMSCVGNDFGYDKVFARFVQGIGKAGDILFAISTSGNSPSILAAVEAATLKRMEIIILTGNDGGLLKDKGTLSIVVPYFGYADRIQEMHIKIIHILIMLTEEALASSA